MTQKQLLAIAADTEAMEILEEIARIQRNMCHKTVYEQKTARAKMKSLAKEIIDMIQ